MLQKNGLDSFANIDHSSLSKEEKEARRKVYDVFTKKSNEVFAKHIHLIL